MNILGSLVGLMLNEEGQTRRWRLVSPLDPDWEVNSPPSLCPAAPPLAAPTPTPANGDVIEAKGLQAIRPAT
ncbi:hypothetical protein I79_015476 [Cricetulus griseus]|uniref:Uncharacterized protein n=1 Tax=Cricetulus griseus TaxID=10029 RepID=G3HWW3_CRIGR|nr:hypothetical protein I79_015476 [Cricetulus griseus]